MNISEYKTIPLIDPEQFNMLVETGEDAAVALLEDLLQLFQDEAEPRFESLREATEKGDFEKVSRTAHALAGSSGNLGGLRLCELCRGLEQEIPTLPAQELPQRVAEIEALYTETVSAFKIAIADLS